MMRLQLYDINRQRVVSRFPLPPPPLPQPLNLSIEELSARIDQAAFRVYEDLHTCLVRSPEHTERCYEIGRQPSKCGETRTAPALLQGASAFEQMVALEYCLTNTPRPLTRRYTFCLANQRFRMEGNKIPLSIQKRASDMMGVMLGFPRGRAHPALVYDGGLSRIDPWQRVESENFIYHLEALEMVRRPQFIGATLLKGNAFESEYIDQDWRYGVKDSQGLVRREASVELKGQNRLSRVRTVIRAESAGFNLIQLMSNNLREADLSEHQIDLQRPGCYMHWPEQVALQVTPNSIIQAAYRTGDLYDHMFRLMIAKIGPQSTPSLQNFVIQRLLESNQRLGRW